MREHLGDAVGIIHISDDWNADVPSILSKYIADELLKINEKGINVNLLDFGELEASSETGTYRISIRLHRKGSSYYRQGLISIKKAKDILEDDNQHIVYVFVDYEDDDTRIKVTRVSVQPIESLMWKYLTIQNLGKGQLQIKHQVRTMTFDNGKSRDIWLSELTDRAIAYYDQLLLKTVEYKSQWVKK